MTTLQGENQQDEIYQWNKPEGLIIFKNNHAAQIQASCEQLLREIYNKYPHDFRESLIDWCIWKHTTCEYVFSS